MIRTNTSNGEYIRLWRPSRTICTRLYAARLISHAYGKHFHEEYTIGINDAGLGSFWCRGTNQLAGPKSLNLLAPGEVHTGAAAASEGWTYRNLYIAPAILEELSRQSNECPRTLPRFRSPLVVDGELWMVIDRLFTALNLPAPQLVADTVLLKSLRLIFERYADQQLSDSRRTNDRSAVSKARRYIEDRYRDEISLQELAGEAGVSPYYLIRCFRKQLGLPPHAYQLQLRLQKAKDDLNSEISLTQIALKHGFFDQSHFHRHFKRAFGVTPHVYRQGNSVQDVSHGRR